MFKSLMTKKLNKKGFTLAELLVVVAILAILVAISVPIFTSKIEEARKSTDLANLRAAKAAAVTEYLSADTKGTVQGYYDAEKGTIETAKPSKGYGKSKTAFDGSMGDPTPGDGASEVAGVIKVKVADDGKVTLSWE